MKSTNPAVQEQIRADHRAADDARRAQTNPDVDDMVPGTSFTALFDDTRRRALFVKVGGATQWPLLEVAAGALATFTVYAIDHSTIQDVTVPKGAL